MAREKKADKLARALEVERRMGEHYPEPECALHYRTPFELTIAVALSAQTTDVNVNKVTPTLFARFGTPEAMAQANVEEVADVIHSLGFFRNKAKNCVACAQMIMSDFGGEVPRDMKSLQKLPGVGRKTANIVLNEGFGSRYTRVPHCAPLEVLQCRHSLANRTRPAQALSPRVLGADQSPMGVVRT